MHSFVSAAGLAGRGGRGARLLSNRALAVWASLTASLGEGHRRVRAFAQHRRAPQAVEQDAAQNGAMETGAGHMSTVEYDRRRRTFAGRESRVDMLRRVSCQRPTQVCPLTRPTSAPTPIAAEPSPWLRPSLCVSSCAMRRFLRADLARGSLQQDIQEVIAAARQHGA